MQATSFRWIYAGLCLSGLFLLSFSLCSQVNGQAQNPPAADPSKKARPQSLEAMTFPADRNTRQMIQAVKDYLEEHKDKPNAPWDKICFAAQQVLDEKSDSFFEVTRADDDTGKIQRVSAKAEANRLVGGLPAAGRQFYQLTYGPPADAMLTAAKNNGYDRTMLAEVSQRYFHTKAGAQATLLLAGLHLDRGNFVESAYSFERLLERPDSDDLWTPRTLFKALVAFRRAGGQSPETMKKLMEQLERKMPRDGLAIGRQRYQFDDLKEELSRPFETLFGRVGESYVAMRLGNRSHTAVADGGRPFLDPTFQISTISPPRGFEDPEGMPSFEGEGPLKVQQNLEQILKEINPAKGEIALPGFFPVTAQNLIIFRGYNGVCAVSARDGTFAGVPVKAGELQWIANTKGNLTTILGGPESHIAERWWTYYRQQQNSKTLLFENPLIGSLSHDGQYVYVIDDTAIPQPPPMPNNEMGFNPQGGPVQPVTKELFDSGSKLIAIHLESGKLAWELGIDFSDANDPPISEEEEDKLTNPLQLMQKSFFLGPPLPLNGKLYVLFEKNGRIRLACLDPSRMQKHKLPILKEPSPQFEVPELLWSQRLGEPNLRLPGDANRRFQCSYLGYSDGVMICPTNAGAVIAVDIMSRSLLWARSYRSIKAPTMPEEGMPGGFNPRRFGRVQPQSAMGSPLPTDRWRASAPIISNGRVVFTAYDSESLDCLDLRTGDLLWTEPKRPGDLYVGGLVEDRIVIVGKETVRALQLEGKPRDRAAVSGREEPQYTWPEIRIGTPAGHGAASHGGIYYLPCAETPDSSQPEVWALDVEKGQILAKTTFRKREGSTIKPMLGNLVFHEGQLFSQSIMELTGFPLIELKKREMDQRLLANPRDPIGLLARGELNLDDGKLKEALGDLKKAQQNSPPAEIQPKLREKLYQVYTEMLRIDFDSAEPYLDEYKALCEVSTDSDDPNVLQRMKDEQVRRKGLYLVLLAKGREKQGRLVDAFEHYREFASLGNNRQLISIYDEPVVLTRPDIWARGRIDAMIRLARNTPASKQLEDHIQKEWDRVQASQDLESIRRFVQVFGHDTEAGREGMLLLADRLVQSGNEENWREAQALLMRLEGTTEDRQDSARAIDAQARLMIRRGLLEDAVSLYSRLGKAYGDVKVQANKSGADLFNETLTDKRLLAYLEPSRVPTPSRVKVTEVRQGMSSAIMQGAVFEADGADSSPLFRRYRLSLVSEAGGGNASNSFTLRVTDRSTGQLVGKPYHGLKALTQGTNLSQYRLAQAMGHILLLHLGNTVYCLDLVEQRELWQYNVLGEITRVDINNMQSEATNDGELIVTYSTDGSKVRLGRSTLLTSTAVCLVTRDGLVAVDPQTGVPLWKRTNVSPSSLIFGDARHVFVVEPISNGKARSRVFRISDGAAVENIPDCGSLVASPGRLRIAGRNILATEGSRTEPRMLRLYDPLEGKDLWKKQYPAGSLILRSSSNDVTGVLTPTGAVEVLDNATGVKQYGGQVDAQILNELTFDQLHPVLYLDSERFYVALNKQQSVNRNWNVYGGYGSMRMEMITGPIVCFDRQTGERRWYTETLFENQQLITERFAESPVLISLTPVSEENGSYSSNRVIVVDKANGKVRHLKHYPQQMSYFTMIDLDTRTGVLKLIGNSMTIEVSPDDQPRVADAGKSREKVNP